MTSLTKPWIRGVLVTIFSASLALTAIGLPIQVAMAAPNFSAPWLCGETWTGTSYYSHDDATAGYYSVDFWQPDHGSGRPVVASRAGTVIYIDPSQGLVIIDHGSGWRTEYGHMKSIVVVDNQAVAQGQLLGLVSNTNTASPHLHFELRLNGAWQRVVFDGDAYPYRRTQTSPDYYGPDPMTSKNSCKAIDAPAVLYNLSNSQARVYRWQSAKSAFFGAATSDISAFDIYRVDDRFAAGDVDGDGDDDLVAAYQNAEGKIEMRVWKQGLNYAGPWVTSGHALTASRLVGRLVVGDWNGDNKAEPALLYDLGNGTMRVYRWLSTGTAFNTYATWDTDVLTGDAAVGERFAAGDIDNDGDDDLVVAAQRTDGKMSLHVAKGAASPFTTWYTSPGSWNLTMTAGRLAVGDYDGNGRAEPAVMHDLGSNVRIYRWLSTGSAFGSVTTVDTGTFDDARVWDRFAAGDIDGDGDDDIVVAYQTPDGKLSYYTWKQATTYAGVWYTSGTFNLNNVASRLVLGRW